MLNYYPIDRSTIPAQKRAAVVMIAASVAILVVMRLFTLAFPGPCLPALLIVLSGLSGGLLGLAWYIVCRFAEE